ncbi:MAG: hypothetical protein IPP18_10735 [Rhodocyclaceae bacterium]|nr:hypothetical protein [Rhodocyclaceae bacterium]MBK6555397.1 hypothetical protein [Rhodocyclaceae bacterium]MBK6676697.1 hypothetical protein [Rhodocyclaceae bacterium]MBK9309321.1 hypothetical protein [Rhodocyclaceae bacterium]MBK9955584.1 hypothetical protein [Rhodocyclaceae bacterium]
MLADVQALVGDLVRDTLDQVSPAQRDTAIELAVARYSADRPRPAVAAAVAPGGDRLPMPAGWPATAKLAWLEWPLWCNPPAQLAHVPLRTLAGDLVAVTEIEVPAGDTVHIHYTDMHVLAVAEDSIAIADREAVAAYAAALVFDQLASLATRNSEPTLNADAVDHKSQAQDYAGRARALRKRYTELLAINDAAAVRPGGASVAWPGRTRFPGAGARR